MKKAFTIILGLFCTVLLVAQVPRENLIAEYRFEKSLADSSGNGNDLKCYTNYLKAQAVTNIDTATFYRLDRFGKKGALLKTEQYTNFLSKKIKNILSNEFSLSFWVYLPPYCHCARDFESFTIANCTFSGGTQFSAFGIAISPSVAAWTHIVLNINLRDSTVNMFSTNPIFSSSTKMYYWDFNTLAKSDSITMFEHGNNDATNFKGYDDIMIFNRMLTADEILAVRNYPDVPTVDVGSPTAINDIQMSDVTIFPNPSTSKITINTTAYSIENLKLRDNQGLIAKEYNQINQVLFELPTNSLPKGVYYLEINNGTITKKIIIE